MRSLDGHQDYSSGSDSPFHDDAPSYPPQARPLLQHAQTEPTGMPTPSSGGGPHVHIADPIDGGGPFREYDVAAGRARPMSHRGSGRRAFGGGFNGGGGGSAGESADMGLGSAGRNASWDLLAGVRKFEQGYERFDSRNASEAHLQFADGDVPKNKVSLLRVARGREDRQGGAGGWRVEGASGARGGGECAEGVHVWKA